MPRRPVPSKADQELLALLVGQGLRCSRHQLERWRQHGLLPRSDVHHLGAEGNVATHPAETTEVAQVLAAWASRGRPWQYLGLVLIAEGLFEHMDLGVARACMLWALDRAESNDRARVEQVTAWLRRHNITDPEPVDIGEAVAALAGSRGDRTTMKQILPYIQQRYPKWQVGRQRELARAGTTWTIAELLGEELTDDLKAVAQGWDSWEDMSRAGWDRLGRPTIEDQRTAVKTVTPDEFVLIWTLASLETDMDDPGYLGGVLARATAQLRYVYGGAYDEPLTDDVLQDLVQQTQERLAQSTP